MESYEDTMRWGASQYRDVTDALTAAGLPAEFLQTGGMCAALQVTLEAGFYLLVTDQEDTLSWDRRDHRGWWVGLYPPEESETNGPIRWLETDEDSVEALLDLAVRVLPGRTGAA